MKLDVVENLTNEEILKLYDDLDVLFISDNTHIFYVECDNNGYRGYCATCGYSNQHFTGTFYEKNGGNYSPTWFCCSRENGGRFYVVNWYASKDQGGCYWNQKYI